MVVGSNELFQESELTMSVEDKYGLVSEEFFKNYGVEVTRKSMDIHVIEFYRPERDTFSEFDLFDMYSKLKEIEGVTVFNLHMTIEHNFGKSLVTMNTPNGGLGSIRVHDNGEYQRLERERNKMLKEMY